MRAVIGIALFLCACPAASPPAGDTTWRAGIEAWKQERLISIAGPDGWITLIARGWLKPGANRFGAAADNELVLPTDHAPAHAGTIFLEGDQLRIEIAAGIQVSTDGRPVRNQGFVDDRAGKPTLFALGPLRFHVIKRQMRWALRVKDREHPARKAFAGLTYYPLEPRLRVQAHLEPAPVGKKLPIVNVLGQVEPMPSPGTLRFQLDGVPYALDAIREDGDDELFILFKDETAGQGTYPSGRFLYIPLPDRGGNVELDFNRAFTPPCGFTAFATCPIPPKQNHLPRKIEAGERYAGAH